MKCQLAITFVLQKKNKLREVLFVYVKVASFRGEIMLLLENY